MYNHSSEDYICPLCLFVQGIENEHNAIKPTDLIFQNETVTAFIGLRSWPNNPGHVLTIPNAHYENIYDLPLSVATEIHKTARAIALAMKGSYGCDGVMLIQRNEPAGGQRAWHYHVHIIPRYKNDHWDLTQRQPFPAAERAEYARKLAGVVEKYL